MDPHIDFDLTSENSLSAKHLDDNIGGEPESSRAKSALRLKYEAETEVIRRKIGDLEAIRSQLGLSQRKMAQLLLVDPSAWTRWTKGGESAPPHVYRMLQWYLALENKYPALDVNFWLNTVAQVHDHSRVPELEFQLQETRAQMKSLEENLKQSLKEGLEVKSRSQFETFSSDLDERLDCLATRLKNESNDSFRFELSQREAQMRRYLVWIAASVLASSLAVGWFIRLITT